MKYVGLLQTFCDGDSGCGDGSGVVGWLMVIMLVVVICGVLMMLTVVWW